MKKTLAVLLAFCAAAALGAANDMKLTQRDPANGADVVRFVPFPGAECLLWLDNSMTRPGCALIGSGLSISGGVLAASAAAAPTWTSITGKPTLFDGAWASLTGRPTTLAAAGLTDAVTSAALTTALGGYATASSLSAYLTTSAAAGTYATQSSLASGLAGKFAVPTGAASQYIRGDGTLATLPAAVAFNFGDPVAKTVALSTSYQAADPSKAAEVSITASCRNQTTVLAASTCTLQFRQHTAAVTCSTGTVVATISQFVNLGLVFDATQGTPYTLRLGAGRYFIACPTAGTWSLTAVEQSAG